MVVDASLTGACEGCHEEISAAVGNSLHTNLWGYSDAINARCDYDPDLADTEGFGLRCAGCHTGCGECHISRPNSVGGGFVEGHNFRKRPHMTDQCTACHGSRVGNDYLGLHDEDGDEVPDYPADVHWGSNFMTCDQCHPGNEMHNMTPGEGDNLGDDLGVFDHRYAMSEMPRCEDCHNAVGSNNYHDAHVNGFADDANLQCQVCHSQPYKNCTTCHPNPAGSEHGFTIESSEIAFKIGVNPLAERDEYDYCVLRHVPVSETDTFNDPMWDGLELNNFDAVPTWKYSSPHNIKLWTAQTTVEEGQGCGFSCHDGEDTYKGIYLRETDLYDEFEAPLPDYDANLPVVIEEFH